MICPQAVQRGGSCAVGSRSDAIAVTIHSRCKWSSHPGRSRRRCLCTSELRARFVSRAGGVRTTASGKGIASKSWSVFPAPIGEQYPLPFDYEPRRHPVQSRGTYNIKERYRMSLDYVAPSLMLPRMIPPPWLPPWRGLSIPTSNADEHRVKREMWRARRTHAPSLFKRRASALWRHNGLAGDVLPIRQ
jgi:hypothetical protein